MTSTIASPHPSRLFANDCLFYRTIKQEDDHQALQKDLKNLEEWANKWGM